MLDERQMHRLRNEICSHKLSICLYKYKIKILNKQFNLTDLTIFEDLEEREGFVDIQIAKLKKYADGIQTCNEQIRCLRRALMYQMSLIIENDFEV